MAHRVVITPAAQADLREARAWYERRQAGLGRRFLEAAREPLDQLAADPFRHPCVLGELRRVRLKRFPYALFYRVTEGKVAVTACLHHRRDAPAPAPAP